MRGFACTHCGNTVYFENVSCLACGHALGFEPATMSMIALEAGASSLHLFATNRAGPALSYCANYAFGVCNWVGPAGADGTYCLACSLNRTIPNLSEFGSLGAWHQCEKAKKRLVYALLRFGLPLDTGASGGGRLTFDFARNVTTGHLDGVIALNVIEADAVERERQRQHFDEPYRSLLGHLRHESGHFYWLMLVEAAGRLDEFRSLFGDEQTDYAEALARHHAIVPKESDPGYLSSYASSHPWEDWAETWAHYLHMVDAVDTAEAMGLEPRVSGSPSPPARGLDPYREASFDELMARWIPLSIAMNNLNRSMGHGDFYPFTITTTAREKLAFVHRVIRGRFH
jgi:hypothetical protein